MRRRKRGDHLMRSNADAENEQYRRKIAPAREALVPYPSGQYLRVKFHGCPPFDCRRIELGK